MDGGFLEDRLKRLEEQISGKKETRESIDPLHRDSHQSVQIP
jgi:hypothetical protein